MWSLSRLGGSGSLVDLSLPTTSARAARAFAALAAAQHLQQHELEEPQFQQIQQQEQQEQQQERRQRKRRSRPRLPKDALKALREGSVSPPLSAASVDDLVRGLTRIKLPDGRRIVDRLHQLHPQPAQLAPVAINQHYYDALPKLLERASTTQLGVALRHVERAGRWDLTLQLAERLPADRPSAIASRMRSHVELGDPSRAIEEFARHESKLSNHRMALITLTEAHLRMRNIERAERVRLKLIELGHGSDVRLQSAIGRAIKALGLVPELEQLLLRDFRTLPLSLSVLNPMLRMRSYEASHQQLANIMSCYRFEKPTTSSKAAGVDDDRRPIADIHTYTILISLCGRCRNLAGIRQVWSGMIATGLVQDAQAWTVSALVRALMNAENVDGARQLLENVVGGRRDQWRIPLHVKLDEQPFLPLLRAAAGRLDIAEIKHWLALEHEAKIRPGQATIEAIMRGLHAVSGSPRYLGALRKRLCAIVDQQEHAAGAGADAAAAVSARTRPAPPPPTPSLALQPQSSPRHLFRQLYDANIPLDADRLLDIVRKYHWYNMSDHAADALVEARALGIAPTPAIWQSLLGHLLARDGHTRMVARAIDRLRRLGVPTPDQHVHTTIGSGLVTRKQFRLADEYMSLAMALTPYPDTILVTVAFKCKIRNNRPDEAAHLLRLADNVPFDGKMVAVVRKAIAWYEKKDKDRANDLRHALEEGQARTLSTKEVPSRLREVGDVLQEAIMM